MQDKKTKKADVDKSSGIWRDSGAIIALLLLVLAFTWKKKEPELPELSSNIEFMEDEEIADVTQEQKKPPPPPPPPIIEVVEDDVVIEEEEEEIDPFEELEDYEVDLDGEFDDLEQKEEKIFMSVEKMPEPDGGMLAFRKWLVQNIKYPQVEREMGIEGKVYVQFVVEKDGSLSNIKLVDNTEELNTPALNDAALSTMRRARPWKPGMQAGAPVRVRYVMPVEFKLSGG